MPPNVAAPVSALFVSLLMLLSGMCALVYQVAWLREFRLVFGGSTAASGAVLSIFMGGLGLGNALFGRRADRQQNPLRLYGLLELGIAGSVLLSPFLIDAARAIYISLGGQMVLGFTGATVARIVLSALVLLVPTVLMGGTLPAAVSAATDPGDARRRVPALIYGCNTLGAVVGTGLSTFLWLEMLGTRRTLWGASLVNVAVGLGAIAFSRRAARTTAAENVSPEPNSRALRQSATAKYLDDETSNPAEAAPPRFVYLAAAVVGFAFFLMELVWFRMLAPLLGGTTFSFGVILGVALAGIGLGGLVWGWGWFSRWIRPTLGSFALTCGLEALFIAVPFALGDRIAVLAAHMRLSPSSGFGDLVAGWIVVGAIVVFPATVVSGIQFPLLVALLGRGRAAVGTQLGYAFAWNTVGAILGSLAGGFGLLPLLSATGSWFAVVIVMCVLGLFAAATGYRRARRIKAIAAPVCVALIALACMAATGPTAVWRHSGIGAARVILPGDNLNEQQEWSNFIQRRFVSQFEGVEASIAIEAHNGYAFYVNGKCDGNAVGDVGTQIMLGVLPAWLHGNAQSAFVVGLGTGESAGWLAEVPSIRRVDVVELEPAVDEMARLCAAVNFDVLKHPKVNRIYNDAREVLLTTPDKYDLIVSEPSNPYRVGVANLFTREFYRSVERRLNDAGLFVQWLQGYEIDARTLRAVLATLRSEFGHVELWQSRPEDLLLVCARQRPAYSAAGLRERLQVRPYREAMAGAWRVVDLEGALARFLAGAKTVDGFRGDDAFVNTDDRNLIEYGFARTLGRATEMFADELRRQAVELDDDRIDLPDVDWERVIDHRQVMISIFFGKPHLPDEATAAQRTRNELLGHYSRGEMQQVIKLWSDSGREPVFPTETVVVALACANEKDERVFPLVEQLDRFNKCGAEAVRALYYLRKGDPAKAASSLESALLLLRENPWAFSHALEIVFPMTLEVAARRPEEIPRLWRALERPFAAGAYEEQRRTCRLKLASAIGTQAILESLETFEPYPIWEKAFLTLRARTYKQAGHPMAARAQADVSRFERNERAPGR